MQIEISQDDIAGTVILYNSPIETFNNIKTYISQVKKLYVVDNSIQLNIELISALQSYSHVHYHSLNGNKGIAAALNWAAKQAITDGFSILLTMDDDTQTPVMMVRSMIDFWNNYSKMIGILSGVHHTKYDNALYRALPYTLTSGNLLNLRAYELVGGFWEELFIDHVDHEYGLRLNENGYQVVELPYIRLDHKLGYSQQLKLGKYVLKRYGTHSPIRQYYFARNGIYIARLYFRKQPWFAWMVIKEISKRWFKAILLDRNREGRLNMLLTGIKDGWIGRLGQYHRE